MGRELLLEQMLTAKGPDETSSAIYAARAWLAAHPDDQRVLCAMEALVEVEQESLGWLR
jgi:hypothetical protein